MVEKSGSEAGRAMVRSAEALRKAFEAAETALADGDVEIAERTAKAVAAMVRAARDLSEFETIARAQPQEEDEEAMRAELRRRVAQLVDAVEADAPDEVLERIASRGVAT